jgi:MFS family permease
MTDFAALLRALQAMKSSSRILMIVLSIVPLGGIGIDLYASSLPAMASHFGANAVATKSTLTVFLIGLFVGMLYSGALSDVVGRKKPQLVNALLFALASVAIPFAGTIEQVIALRFMQGVSAGGMQAVCRSIMSDSFSPAELTTKSLYVTTVWGVGPIFAPWIGGLLVTAYGWTSCFYLLGAYGCALAALIAWGLPETNPHRERFCVAQLRRDVVQVIAHNDFLLPAFAMGCAYASLVAYGAVGPYFVQVTLRLSAATYGNIGLIVGCGYLLGNLVLRLLLAWRWSEDRLLNWAVGCTLVGVTVSMALQSGYPGVHALWIASVLADCLMMGFVYPIYMAKSLRVHPGRSGLASAMTVSAVLLFASIFGAVASAFTVRSSLQFLGVYLVLSVGIVFVRIRERVRVRPFAFEREV